VPDERGVAAGDAVANGGGMDGIYLCANIPAQEISLFASLLKFMRFQLIPNYRKRMPPWCAVLVTSFFWSTKRTWLLIKDENPSMRLPTKEVIMLVNTFTAYS
jgi:hypothetical protein